MTKVRNTLILFGFIALKFIIQYNLISPEYELHRDEYLHLDMAHHWAWGYLSVPPVTSWISSLIYLLGNSDFWVKFFPALFGALTITVVWKAIEELGGNTFALILGATCVLFSALLRLNTLYQPNSLDVLTWVTFYFVVIKYFNTENSRWLYIAATVLAVGFLNKYNIVFALPGFIPALLLSKQYKVFIKRDLYISGLLGLLLVSPNLMWQYNNDFSVVHHMRQLAELQLVHVDRLGFLKSQLLFYMGSLFVIISSLYAFWFYEPFHKYRPFFWSIFFTLLVFLYFRAKDYYAIGLYPIYISFGSVFISHFLRKGWFSYLRPVAIATPIVLTIPLFGVAFPNKSPEYIASNSALYKKYGLLRWEDGKDHELPQDFADMLGWQELANKVDSIYAALPNKEQTLVLCDNYGQAGAINYYSQAGIKAVSFSADYVYWFDLDTQYTDVIRVINHWEVDDELKETAQYFQEAYPADLIRNPYAREYKATICVFLSVKIDVNELLRKEIEEVKNFK
ncbi:MAG: glycosyltransferase family 39 protein [Cyclobacteriaceae bacterium]